MKIFQRNCLLQNFDMINFEPDCMKQAMEKKSLNSFVQPWQLTLENKRTIVFGPVTFGTVNKGIQQKAC